MRKRKPGEQAERRQVDRDKEIYAQSKGAETEMGRHSWGDRGTHRKKQAYTPRKTGRHTPERQSKAGGQKGTEEPGPPKAKWTPQDGAESGRWG